MQYCNCKIIIYFIAVFISHIWISESFRQRGFVLKQRQFRNDIINKFKTIDNAPLKNYLNNNNIGIIRCNTYNYYYYLK